MCLSVFSDVSSTKSVEVQLMRKRVGETDGYQAEVGDAGGRRGEGHVVYRRAWYVVHGDNSVCWL